MDEYFVTAQPRSAPPEPEPEPEPLTAEDVASIDLSGLHEPLRVPRSVTVLALLGRLVLGLFLLAAAAAPLLLLVAFFRFLDSLPF